MSPTCPHCLSEYNDGAAYCCHCGHAVRHLSAAETVPDVLMVVGALVVLFLVMLGVREVWLVLAGYL